LASLLDKEALISCETQIFKKLGQRKYP